jgi:hypothetical protein
VTFQVMRRTLGTDMQGHGTMKDAQQILLHASITTTAEIYMQEIQASVRSAINSRTRAIFRQRNRDLSQLENAVPYHRAQLLQTSEYNGSKRFQVRFGGICKCLKRMAPQVGLEPTTLRLTAGCSAIELLRSVVKASAHLVSSYHRLRIMENRERVARRPLLVRPQLLSDL